MNLINNGYRFYQLKHVILNIFVFIIFHDFQKINKLTDESDEISMSLLEPEQKLQVVKQIQGDMPLLDRYNQEVKQFTKEVSIFMSILDIQN